MVLKLNLECPKCGYEHTHLVEGAYSGKPGSKKKRVDNEPAELPVDSGD